MLQQTTVVTVKDYFLRFIQKWPTVNDLASANLNDLLIEWQGLGYYSRARNLHKCVQSLAISFPEDPEDLIKLPGIGPYTSNAIAAIAFNKNCIPVDGNVIRVFARYFGVSTPLPKLKSEIEALAQTFSVPHNSGYFAQALMDLGATICKPQNALCHLCPVSFNCSAFKSGLSQKIPFKEKKPKIPTKYGHVFIHQKSISGRNHYLIEKGPESGLLSGLYTFPTSIWTEDDFPPLPLDSEIIVKHAFTHFKLNLKVIEGSTPFTTIQEPDQIWAADHDIMTKYPISTLMKKVFKTIA